MGNYEFISDYKHNKELRISFEALAQKTFGIRFEEWYQLGFWREAYIPYSIMDGRRIISNVSVNKMSFHCNGRKKFFLQLGTVMTDTEFRGKGLNRQLIERILADYKDTCEGIYLFANDSVLDYYPKFGFEKAAEYQYSKKVRNTGEKKAVPWPMTDKSSYAYLEERIRKSWKNSLFEMDNAGLYLFYLTYFMKNSVYYIEELKTYVIAEEEEGTLFLHQVISEQEAELDRIIAAFGKDITKVVLGFTPLSSQGFDREELKEEDTTLFILGKGWEEFRKGQLRFPVLSHA
ncbi:Acetyltransferase (GNAT) domain-containing protein [Anaerocolumna jejuensis DSM 15929]|uniref:Acetyltransferase (GNAT) domain-containing protein n=1 Tax=Anaerocolumna jejuensis DSM 15929 TaxID=1121322 RepID=A0A1M7CCD7_9FIRM|nr:GNAT family N-acetyltransferase [Anaerocolumna jejuensis]SHL64874.1 Acetyltransferase (GNAT) domain-containing protein [Anaerocolumna jejuensis DSM 15929]